MDCSPITQRMASEMLDLPEPLGPTMAVMSSPKVSTVLSGKDLNPWISNALRYISTPLSFHNLLSPLFQGVPGFLCLHNPLQISITFQCSGVNPGAKWCWLRQNGVNLYDLDFAFQALKTCDLSGLGCLIIDIHRCPNISMAHHILDYLEIFFIFAEPCAESVAQYVGTELW